MKEIEGIIIHQLAQKEKDAMLSFLTNEGLLSIYARGIKDNKSKNAHAVSVGCLSFRNVSDAESPKSALIPRIARFILQSLHVSGLESCP